MANDNENQDEREESKLTPLQKELMKAIETKDLAEFNKVLAENPREDINFTDDDKMTPLQQAAYRGNADMVKVLLKRGADVNKCEHANDYTTLHFGALSGNVDVCHLLLAAGVKTNALNSINRTAAQLASFVGYHNIVSTINNFIPKSDIDYYTKVQGTQAVPLLSAEIAENMYKLVLMYNMHPIKIAMLLNAYDLADHIDSVRKVLELMSEKEMKAKATNEVLGFKYHYMAFMLGEIKKTLSEMTEIEQGKKDINGDKGEEVDKREKTFVQVFAKVVLKINRKGDQEVMDLMIRQAVKSFPYIESILLRQMVVSLTPDEDCSARNASALSIVSAAVNGQRAFVDESTSCGTCGEEKATKKCSKCKSAAYCDRDCQKLHWFVHKKMCGVLAAQSKQQKVQVDSKELNDDLAGILSTQ